MARQPDIQYVRFYTAGSAARKLEVVSEPQKRVELPKPRVRRQPRKVIRIDPIALCAVLVAVLMFVAMVAGVVELASVSIRADKMESYAAGLESENVRLWESYKAGYDLEEVEQKALAMGMVPADQVEHITIQVQNVQPEPEPTFWEELRAMIAELFA